MFSLKRAVEWNIDEYFACSDGPLLCVRLGGIGLEVPYPGVISLCALEIQSDFDTL